MSPRAFVLPAAGAVLCLMVGWLSLTNFRTSLQITFAEEQTEIFEEMSTMAEQSLRESPPDVQSAVGCLQYVHNYYPSGTKQKTGSRLDKIVERSRFIAESRIIQMLRVATGEELGDKIDAWVGKYAEERVPSSE